MSVYLFALLIGMVAGLRTFTALAAASWAARLGRVDLYGTWLSFMALVWTPWISTVLALGELVTDQLPSTPSRLVPMQFSARVISGALSGAALVGATGSMVGGALAGIVGAIIGTLGGHALRRKLAQTFGRDTPAALIEDALAVGGAFLIITALP